MRPDRFFQLSDGVIARLQGGWRSQVWQPESQQWADYPDLDIAGEGQEVTAEQATQAGALVEEPEPPAQPEAES